MMPNNPVVGGTILRRAAIQSPNFVQGVSGWSIQSNGDAFFADVTIVGGTVFLTDSLGAVVGQLDGVNGLVFLGTGTLAKPQFAINPSGVLVWDNASSLQTQNAAVDVASFVDSAGKARLAWIVSSGELSGKAAGEFLICSAPADGSEPPMALLATPGMFLKACQASGEDEVWHAIAPLNGWTNAGTPNAPFGCYLDPLGRVWLRGAIASGTTADGTHVGALPAGYYNTNFQQFMSCAYTTSSATSNPRLVIDTSGNITINGVSGMAGDIGFDGLSFPII